MPERSKSQFKGVKQLPIGQSPNHLITNEILAGVELKPVDLQTKVSGNEGRRAIIRRNRLHRGKNPSD